MLASRADVYTIRCSCKQWPCTYTAPCVARTCWEESQTHIAATLWQRLSTHTARTLMHATNATRRGEILHRLAAPHPAAAPAGERPAPPARPRSDRPAASRTHAAHNHTAQIRHLAAHAGSCATPVVSHDQSPDSTKARPTIKPDRLFLLHDGTGHRLAAAIRQDATVLSKPVAAPGRS